MNFFEKWIQLRIRELDEKGEIFEVVVIVLMIFRGGERRGIKDDTIIFSLRVLIS